MAKWKCSVCGYIYDEEKGDPANGIPSYTAFSDLPPTWTCPVCGATKDAFDLLSKTESPIMNGMTVSDAMVAELEAWGVNVVFGLPGTSSLGLVDAVRKNPRMRYIVVRHEENAAMAASAYNKLTGKIAACLTIAGPGATNLSTGLYDAKEDHAPVISLNGQVEIQYTGPGGIQEIDQDAFFRPITVFNNTVYEKNVAILLLNRALKYAILHRGVAQLSVPNDVQKQHIDSKSCPRESILEAPAILPAEVCFTKAADAINRAKNPVILAGWGARTCAQDVLSLANLINAPILTTFRAKGIIPDDNPHLIGILGSVGSPQARTLATNADLIIALGVGFSKFTNVPECKPMVQVDLDPIKLARNSQCSSLWGEMSEVLPKLLSFLNKKEGLSLEKIAALKKEWDDQRDREADPGAVPIRPPFIMKVLSEVVPEDAIISLDVGENQWWFGRNFRMKHQKFCMSGYLATMGFGFPGAIAAKLAYPDRQVFCITGDGGFSMAMAELVTAAKYRLPLIVIILNNRQLGMIQVEQLTEGYPNYGTDLLNPDFARYAESCGAVGINVKKPGDLAPAVKKALSLNTLVVIDVETDPKRF